MRVWRFYRCARGQFVRLSRPVVRDIASGRRRAPRDRDGAVRTVELRLWIEQRRIAAVERAVFRQLDARAHRERRWRPTAADLVALRAFVRRGTDGHDVPWLGGLD